MDMTSTQTAGKELRYNPAVEISPLVEVSKTIHAPLAQVWKAWMQPELIRQWWGPKGFSCPYATVNFKVGGDYLFAMKDNRTEQVLYSTGLYQKIDPERKIVFTDHFCNSDGVAISAEEAGMSGVWPEVLTITITFKNVDADETLLSPAHEGIPAEMHDDCVEGWESCFEKLEKLLRR